MDVNQINAQDVIVFVFSGILVIFLMFGFIIYFLMSYRQKRQDYILLEEQKKEIDRQKIILEKTLSELKQTQAQLIQSEKMASLGELVAGIAHEIQNPLNFVNNFAGINRDLLEELTGELKKDESDETEYLIQDLISNEQKIMEHGRRAEGIVKSMLEHSRAGKGQKESVDVSQFCEEYMKVAYEENRNKWTPFHVEYSLNLIQDTIIIEGMRQDLGRVLLNIINNAFYAAQQRWKQTNSAGHAFYPHVTLSNRIFDHHVQLIIEDNGTGITEEDKNKIFMPFFTTKPTGQGTGLGLSLSMDIVKAHGGNIEVQSTPGAGTTFIISLPLKQAIA